MIINRTITTIIFILTLTILFVPNTAIANTPSLGNLDFDTILHNISSLFAPLTRLTLAVCYVSGVAFIFRGVTMLHTFGQIQYQMNKPNGIAGPFLYILIGSVLIYLPSTIASVSSTILGDGNFINFFDNADTITLTSSDGQSYTITNTPNYGTQGSGSKYISYLDDLTGGNEWQNLIDVIVQFIQFVGLIAFVRGWFILSHLASGSNSQQDSFSKGIIHIIGGIISINFMPFMQAVSSLIFSSV